MAVLFVTAELERKALHAKGLFGPTLRADVRFTCRMDLRAKPGRRKDLITLKRQKSLVVGIKL